MAAGLAVQAATLGFVPYQIVQVLLQLALAAAESAIDLDMMSKGLDVAVVKTKDTWTMSVSGAIGLLKDTATAYADNLIQTAFTKAADYVNAGINNILNAATEDLQGAVTSLTGTVEAAAKSKGEEIVNAVYMELQGKIESALNEIQYIDYATVNADGSITYLTQAEVHTEINTLFDGLRDEVAGILAKYTDNPIAAALQEDLIKAINDPGGVIDSVESKIIGIVDDAYASLPGEQPNLGAIICGEMLQIKYDIITGMQSAIGEMSGKIETVANDKIAEISGKINEYAQECVTDASEQLSEEAAKAVKDKVIASLNEFSNTYLKDTETVDIGKIGEGANKSTSSSVASMIKFGYKDYLMLLMFISICVNDEPILARTADIIQLNMMHATGTPDVEGQNVFQHAKGTDFKLSNAQTYVSVESSVKMDMLFLKMDFFNDMLLDDGEDPTTQLEAGSTITYKAVAGY